MNAKTVSIDKNATTLAEVIANLLPRQKVNAKAYPDYYNGIKAVHSAVYGVYKDAEAGTLTAEKRSAAMTVVTEFLHTLGRVNGRYISVVEKTAEKTESGEIISAVLFDTLVYNSFMDYIYTTSADFASLLADFDAAKAKKNDAHKALLEGRGTAAEYKKAAKTAADWAKKVKEAQAVAGNESKRTIKKHDGTFATFVTNRLQAIIENRMAMSEEESEAIRKARNKANKERKAEAKTTEAPAEDAKQTNEAKPADKKPGGKKNGKKNAGK